MTYQMPNAEQLQWLQPLHRALEHLYVPNQYRFMRPRFSRWYTRAGSIRQFYDPPWPRVYGRIPRSWWEINRLLKQIQGSKR